jgi:CDP-2,3-bis-(O-geranylgeranyl)-sn-glycerol synthase
MTPASASNAENFVSPEPMACAVFIVAAFVFSGAAHVLWLRSAASMKFGFPIDFGLSLNGKRILGGHKMLRGFVVMVPATGAAFFLLFVAVRMAIPCFAAQLWTAAPWQYAVWGAWAGLGFMAGELPNSFVKRRLKIPPGGLPALPSGRSICFVADRVDSILGMLAALSIVVSVPVMTWIYVIVAGAGIHWTFSVVLFALGVKERMA